MAFHRNNFWVDVEGGWRGWIETPNSGADSSPSAWGTDGTLLNGGGYSVNSWGSHKRYVYEWRDSSARRQAQFMKSLRDGTFGRGLIHFVEPTLYDQNVLPARWADPSMAIGEEGSSLVYGVEPTPAATASTTQMLPVISAQYDLSGVIAGYRGDWDSLYVTIPEGHTLALGAFYSATGSGGIFATPVNFDGSLGTAVRLDGLPVSSESSVSAAFSNVRGVRLWVGRTSSAASTVTITAMCARLIESSKLEGGIGYGEGGYGEGPYGGETAAYSALSNIPWLGGMGHSGVRFQGTPTFVNNTGVNGGQVGFAATFVEVGSWA